MHERGVRSKLFVANLQDHIRNENENPNEIRNEFMFFSVLRWQNFFILVWTFKTIACDYRLWSWITRKFIRLLVLWAKGSKFKSYNAKICIKQLQLFEANIQLWSFNNSNGLKYGPLSWATVDEFPGPCFLFEIPSFYVSEPFSPGMSIFRTYGCD